jgi:hypothetical protein
VFLADFWASSEFLKYSELCKMMKNQPKFPISQLISKIIIIEFKNKKPHSFAKQKSTVFFPPKISFCILEKETLARKNYYAKKSLQRRFFQQKNHLVALFEINTI